jgi:LCP family protein required for cell wall assembly
VTGPYDGQGGESKSPPPRRSLPPELDPRRPVARRGSGQPKSSATGAAIGGAASGGGGGASGPPAPPSDGEHRRWGPGWFRRWSRKRLLGMSAGAVLGIVAVLAVIAYFTINGILGRIHKKECPSCLDGGKGLNILIIGSDSRAGLTHAQQTQLHVGHDSGSRSDTMILLHIPADGRKAEMVSLPRDSYVTIPKHCPGGNPPKNNKCPKGASVVPAAKNKLNASYSFGGANLAVATVEANTGVPISHYIEINFLGFVNMVDKLGGVTICNANAINDPVHYDSSTGGYVGSGLQIPAGKVKLNGTKALEFVRAREFDPAQGDLGRIQRQQKFMAAMLNKAESAGVLLNIPRLVSFLNAVAGSLTTDSGLGKGDEISLAKKLHSMSPKNVDLLTVPLSNTALSTAVGSAVEWDPVLSKRLFHDFKVDKAINNVTRPSRLTIAPSNIALKVLNAAGTQGLAGKAASDLHGLGFSVSKTGNAPNGSNKTATVVVYGPSRAESARTVAAAVTGAILKSDSSLGSGIELLVGSSYEGVKPVKISTSSSHRPTVTTGASHTCS